MKIIDNIKQRFLKKKSKKSVAKNRQVKIKLPQEFLKVLIISNNENDSLYKSAETVFLNAEVNALFLRKQKEDNSSQFRYSVNSSDFNLTGGLKNDKLNKLIRSHFDLVVDLSNDSELLNYFLQTIESDLVIGKLGNSIDDLHDLFFEFGANELSFLTTVKTQLNHLSHGHK